MLNTISLQPLNTYSRRPPTISLDVQKVEKSLWQWFGGRHHCVLRLAGMDTACTTTKGWIISSAWISLLKVAPGGVITLPSVFLLLLLIQFDERQNNWPLKWLSKEKRILGKCSRLQCGVSWKKKWLSIMCECFVFHYTSFQWPVMLLNSSLLFFLIPR